MKHAFALTALLLAALVSYAVGSIAGTMALVGAGVVLELYFWYRLFHRSLNRR